MIDFSEKSSIIYVMLNVELIHSLKKYNYTLILGGNGEATSNILYDTVLFIFLSPPVKSYVVKWPQEK